MSVMIILIPTSSQRADFILNIIILDPTTLRPKSQQLIVKTSNKYKVGLLANWF